MYSNSNRFVFYLEVIGMFELYGGVVLIDGRWVGEANCGEVKGSPKLILALRSVHLDPSCSRAGPFVGQASASICVPPSHSSSSGSARCSEAGR